MEVIMKKLLITFLLVIALATVCADEIISADFTMDNVDPTVDLTAPANADVLASESTSSITWSASDGNLAINPITIEYRENGTETLAVIASTEVNDGTYGWTAPDVSSVTAEIKITAVDNFGNSGSANSIFAIANDYGDYVETIVDIVDPPVINLPVINFGTVEHPVFEAPSIQFTFASAPTAFPLRGQISTLPTHLLPNNAGCLAALQANLPQNNATTIVIQFNTIPIMPTELVWWNGSSWEDITVSSGAAFEQGSVTFTWTSATRGEEEFAVNNGSESTLPVQFSGFTASQTTSDFVSLNWFTHSESSLIGYNVYRSDDSNLNNGLRINPSMISATNSAIGGNYSLEDREVEINSSYSYWVQVVEISGDITYHGPTKISLVGEAVNEAPAMTTLYSAYPNPFNPTTTIKFNVKENDKATLIIANIKGQIVKSYPAYNTGEHTIIWNGDDNRGNKVSSGFYFYKLKSETTQQIRKMLLLK